MPRRKDTIQGAQQQGIILRLLSSFKLGESYTNLMLGAIVVVAIGTAFFIFARDSRNEQTSSTTTEPTGEEQKDELTSSTYTVKVGDSLWSISESVYKTGYSWVQIAKANNLENPGLIHAGNKLKLPAKEQVAKSGNDTVITEKPAVNGAITGNKYTVKKGDNLWNIAVRAYGDGFRYVEIADVNKLVNPNLIHSGNILEIPRK